MARTITYIQAVNEALDQALAKYPNVFVMGEGVPDPKGIFGLTLGLRKKYGPVRVRDMPVAENGMTGICIGAALTGMRPVMFHQRVDFSLLAFDQIANCAAKWHYMFGGKASVPLVIHMIVGRGWGQGSQHSQSLQTLYAHIPGLKVLMPSSAYDAKGLYLAAIEDNNPVIFIDHRWLHNTIGKVPEKYYTLEIGKPHIVRQGNDITLVATSHMVIESLKAIEVLQVAGISVELIDLRTIKPIDFAVIQSSVKKTGKLLVADTGVKTLSVAAEIITGISEECFGYLSAPPGRVTLPDIPTPTSWKLSEKYYPNSTDIIRKVLSIMQYDEKNVEKVLQQIKTDHIRSDVPDMSFTGPF